MKQQGKIPQPKQIPILGNTHLLSSDEPVQSLQAMAADFGEIYRLNLAGTDLIVVSSQRLVNELCDEARFEKKLHRSLQEIRAFAGDALFTAETEEPNWQKAHRILMPVFGPVAIRDMFDGMLDIASQMFLKWERLGDGAVIDVADNMTRLTLDTIALCSFNYRFNSFYQNEMHSFVDAMVGGLSEANLRAKRPGFANDLLVGKKKKFEANIDLMSEIADSLVARRKANPNKSEKKDLLDAMLTAKDPVTGEGLDDLNIRYQMVTFLIAGHETTSGLLSFATYAMLKNPEVLRKAQEEIDSVLQGRMPKVTDIPRLDYIDWILKETLRMWPTAPAFSVTPLKDEESIGEQQYKLKREEIILVLSMALHRDPSAWDKPNSFDPERWSPERVGSIPENAWKPFGNGKRACIGRSFAIQEAVLVLAMMIQNFEFEFENPSYQLSVKETLTLKPGDLNIKIKKRGASSLVSMAATGGESSSQQKVDLGKAAAGTGIPFLVMYGSNSGSSEYFARQVAAGAEEQGHSVQVGPMNDFVGKIPKGSNVVVVTASYEGLPPENAKQFVKWSEQLSEGELEGVGYTVFGCGNRDWTRTYQAVPKLIDQCFARAGAKRLYERGEADAKSDLFGGFDKWYTELWATVAPQLGVAAVEAQEASIEIEYVAPERETVVRSQGLEFGTVVQVRELVDLSKPNARSKIHVEIELPEGQSYRAGDYLTVLGQNPPENVQRVLKRFAVDGHATIKLHGAALPNMIPVGRPVIVQDILSSYIELGQPATQKQIQALAESCPCPPEKMELLALTETLDVYRSKVLEQRVSVLELLERYQSCQLPFAKYLQMMPALKPRQYSISSSPLRHPRHCTLTVAVVNSKALSGQGNFLGVTSNFLANLKPGDAVPLLPKVSSQDFHLPTQPEFPIVMACAGTGLAPFRGFIEERAMLKKAGKPVGPAILFFGCDHPDIDFLYREELEAYQKEGVVQLRMAYSSLVDKDVKYVQHRLWQDREVMALMDEGAQFFVCGDGARMAPAVHQALVDSFCELKQVSKDEGLAWIKNLEDGGRYAQDVFS